MAEDMFLRGVYIFSNIAYTGVLIWGFRSVSVGLKTPVITTDPNTGKPVQSSNARASGGWHSMLRSRSRPTVDGNGAVPAPNPSQEPDISYARVSGAIGSIALASLFVGMSYWILYALFYGVEGGTFDIAAKINSMGGFFLAGAALFLPYAFDRLASIFKI